MQKYIDNEADFWKEHFVHLQHKNMVRTNAEPLRLENCEVEFKTFAAAHTDANINIEFFDSYCTFEVILTPDIKLRLFVQSSIKGSLLQKHEAEYVKICDAKFPYNPLPEIYEFLQKLPDYLKELEKSKEEKSRSNRRQKIVLEFIKAYAAKHLKKPFKVSANEDDSFTLSLPADSINIQINEENFMQKLQEIKE